MQIPGSTRWCALARTREAAEAALTLAQQVLTDLQLTLHPEKTRIVDAHEHGFDFLGFTGSAPNSWTILNTPPVVKNFRGDGYHYHMFGKGWISTEWME